MIPPSDERSDVEQPNGNVLLRFPPLPAPDYTALRSQTVMGCALVLGLCVTFVTLTLVAAAYFHELPGTARRAFPSAICVEATLAIISLLGLMLGDPGVIRRCPEFSLPLPWEIEEKMHEGIPLERLQTLKNLAGEGGFTYCVRCFVWRPPRSHHCRTCGRCVRDFDHHCGVFGRCIAGSQLHGNMKYFVLVIAMGYLGGMTCASCVIWAASLRWGLWAFPYLFLAYIVFAGLSMVLSGLWYLVRRIIERCNEYEKVAIEDSIEAVQYGVDATANAVGNAALEDSS
mmetsp:Transcript_36775/g.64768  ORF Transcript_36775/g.64768 Transcript_36775/m.64768 type:complete len:286 (-) Transcript_36775:42-899(-)